jgi:hypothetical protein
MSSIFNRIVQQRSFTRQTGELDVRLIKYRNINMRIISSIFTISIIIFLSCSKDNSSTNPEEIPDCSGEVEISVNTGTIPIFSWTPECKIFFLLVEPAESGTDLWSIITEGSNSISPGVKYGEVPEGAHERFGPVELVTGNEYKVVLYHYTGPDPQDVSLIGIKNFVP